MEQFSEAYHHKHEDLFSYAAEIVKLMTGDWETYRAVEDESVYMKANWPYELILQSNSEPEHRGENTVHVSADFVRLSFDFFGFRFSLQRHESEAGRDVWAPLMLHDLQLMEARAGAVRGVNLLSIEGVLDLINDHLAAEVAFMQGHADTLLSQELYARLLAERLMNILDNHKIVDRLEDGNHPSEG